MNEDAELLQQYAKEHSEAAFADLVRRHLDLTYSTALRLVHGDTHRAEDVTQQVFAELARQAHRLIAHPALVGWLYTTTRLIAQRVIRTELRRKAREQEAVAMNEPQSNAEPNWDQLKPLLETAMHQLGGKDRLAVLLRFFQNKSLKEVGTALGVGENAAQMRVARALDKLRVQLSRSGVALTSVALAAALSGNAVTGAPAALGSVLVGASLASAVSGTTTPFALFKLTATTKLQVGALSAIVVASLITSLTIHQQAQAKIRETDDAWQRQTDQLAQLQSGNERLSSLAARLRAPGELDELARLRSEARLLREETDTQARLREENRRLRPVWPSRDSSPMTILQMHEQLGDRMHNGRDSAVLFQMYADDHHGQSPTNMAALSKYNEGWGDPEKADRFEIVYRGSIADLKEHEIAILREKQPEQFPDGKWRRVYVFLDGHSERQTSPDVNFEKFESEHIIKGPSK